MAINIAVCGVLSVQQYMTHVHVLTYIYNVLYMYSYIYT